MTHDDEVKMAPQTTTRKYQGPNETRTRLSALVKIKQGGWEVEVLALALIAPTLFLEVETGLDCLWVRVSNHRLSLGTSK